MPELTRRTVREDDKGTGTFRGAGPLASLEQNEYKFSSFNYPIDIEKLSHAMLFNINVQDGLLPGSTTGDLSSNREQLADGEFLITESRQQRVSRNVRNNISPGQQTMLPPMSLGVTRFTKRIKRAISLYVPETLVFDDMQEYKTPHLTEKFGLAGTSALSAMSANPRATAAAGAIAAVAAARFPAIAQAVAEALSRASSADIRATKALMSFAPMFGFAVNPVIEVLYSSPRLRKFRFQFVFAPKSRQEADMVWQIIYEFRRHSAPEVLARGALFIPPSEFEITFLRKTMTESIEVAKQIGGQVGGPGSAGSFVENTNMPRISTCVLESVQTDYASTGAFATFQDGMPVQISMNLQFLELDTITRESIDKGY